MADRMDKLEDEISDVKEEVVNIKIELRPLQSLPKQIEALIEIQRETNRDIRDLTAHMSANYISEKMCNEKCAAQNKSIDQLQLDVKDARKIAFTALFSLLTALLMFLLSKVVFH